MSCPHRFDAGVYVLGALSPSERSAFEEHLDGCAGCRRDLRDFGGLPGLLARVPAPPVTDSGPETPDDPPPDLLAAVMRRRRHSRRRALALAAAAVVVALVGGGVLAGVLLPGRATTDTPVRTVALSSVDGVPVRGDAGLVAKPWGTEVSLRCRYLGAPAPAEPPVVPAPVYVLVVLAPDGTEQQVARWSPPPGQDVDIGASTDLRAGAVAGLEVRTDTGRVVLRS